MMNAAVRTTITLQSELFTQLKFVSLLKRKKISVLIQEALRSALEKEESAQLDAMYHQLGTMVGMIKEPIPRASKSIDEMLYGEDGLWKGERG